MDIRLSLFRRLDLQERGKEREALYFRYSMAGSHSNVEEIVNWGY
jgi:hypothetical protein